MNIKRLLTLALVPFCLLRADMSIPHVSVEDYQAVITSVQPTAYEFPIREDYSSKIKRHQLRVRCVLETNQGDQFRVLLLESSRDIFDDPITALPPCARTEGGTISVQTFYNDSRSAPWSYSYVSDPENPETLFPLGIFFERLPSSNVQEAQTQITHIEFAPIMLDDKHPHPHDIDLLNIDITLANGLRLHLMLTEVPRPISKRPDRALPPCIYEGAAVLLTTLRGDQNQPIYLLGDPAGEQCYGPFS